MSDSFPGADAHVATSTDRRHRMQCADILLSDQPSRRAARRWITSTWTGYPGCVVAAARDQHGRWCLIETRDAGALLVRATGSSIVDQAIVELAARVRYDQWIAAGAAP
ncbi:MAG TPA: hypothetical protein VGX25_08690 [Actinophytocola sp.]|uniref:hypothetical protein n=1 Tax=Actinophytocola sp. TaxID=1872138 RepID=UPI002DDD0FD0|nr:hypothetical protein [Actinophytocola sp.]HEV2779465.1 hypothetical protein [Actinophytocola sp.]